MDSKIVWRIENRSASADALEEFVGAHLSKITVRPRAGSNFSSHVKMHAIGQTLVWTSDFPQGAEVQPQSPPDAFIVHMPTRSGIEFSASALQSTASPRSGFIEDGRRTTVIRHSERNRQLGLAIPRAQFTSALAARLGNGLRHDLEFSPNFDLEAAVGQTLRSLASSLVSGLQDETSLASAPLAAFNLTECILQLMLNCFPHNYSHALSSPQSPASPRHVKIAVDYIRAHAQDPLTVPHIAEVAGVSVRGLEIGFRRFLETTVVAYVREVRLAGARRDLIDPTDKRSTAQIARSWGFVGLGHFATHYARTFGERPCSRRNDDRSEWYRHQN